MNPGHWRQPQIIRLLAAAGLAALALVPISASAQSLDSARDKGVPCVSCLVIGITPADLASPPQLAPGSLEEPSSSCSFSWRSNIETPA